MKNEMKAFPASSRLLDQYTGMDLRDYFAAKALHGTLINEKSADGITVEERAWWSYMQADAMMEARKK